jgi:tetratricopeptide (TPR) repeat protein
MDYSEVELLSKLQKERKDATLHHKRGHYIKAEAAMKQVVQNMEQLLGAENTETIESMWDLALIYLDLWHLDDAHRLLLQVEKSKEKLGPRHCDNLRLQLSQARIAVLISDFGPAEAMLEALILSTQTVLGTEHRVTLQCRTELAELYFLRCGPDDEGKAISELKNLKRTWYKALGKKDPDSLRCGILLAKLQMRRGHVKKGQKGLESKAALQRKVLGEGHPERLQTVCWLAWFYAQKEQFEKATKIFKELIALTTDAVGERQCLTLNCRWLYVSSVSIPSGHYESALRDLEQILEVEICKENRELIKLVRKGQWDLCRRIGTEIFPRVTGTIDHGDCLICLDTMEAQDVLTTPCNHTFHSSCAKDWLKHQEWCSACRRSLYIQQ